MPQVSFNGNTVEILPLDIGFSCLQAFTRIYHPLLIENRFLQAPHASRFNLASVTSKQSTCLTVSALHDYTICFVIFSVHQPGCKMF